MGGRGEAKGNRKKKKKKKGKVEKELYQKIQANFRQWSITSTEVKHIHTNNHFLGLEPHSKNLLKLYKEDINPNLIRFRLIAYIRTSHCNYLINTKTTIF